VRELVRFDPYQFGDLPDPEKREKFVNEYEGPEDFWENEFDGVKAKKMVDGEPLNGLGEARRMSLYAELSWEDHRTFLHYHPDTHLVNPVVDGEEYGHIPDSDPDPVPVSVIPDLYRVSLAAEELEEETFDISDDRLIRWGLEIQQKYGEQEVDREFYDFLERQGEALQNQARESLVEDALEQSREDRY
jgi:hypothetical protein